MKSLKIAFLQAIVIMSSTAGLNAYTELEYMRQMKQIERRLQDLVDRCHCMWYPEVKEEADDVVALYYGIYTLALGGSCILMSDEDKEEHFKEIIEQKTWYHDEGRQHYKRGTLYEAAKAKASKESKKK